MCVCVCVYRRVYKSSFDAEKKEIYESVVTRVKEKDYRKKNDYFCIVVLRERSMCLLNCSLRSYDDILVVFDVELLNCSLTLCCIAGILYEILIRSSSP